MHSRLNSRNGLQACIVLESLSANRYRLHGEIDMQDSSLLLRELLALPQTTKEGDLYLDLAELHTADSLLLAALLDLQRQLQKNHARLLVSGMADSMRGLAFVYGIESLFDDMIETTR